MKGKIQENLQQKMGKMMVDASEAFYAMKNEAFEVIRVLYNELYSGEGGDVE